MVAPCRWLLCRTYHLPTCTNDMNDCLGDVDYKAVQAREPTTRSVAVGEASVNVIGMDAIPPGMCARAPCLARCTSRDLQP
eukprot:4258112-Amphidinium_carterae.2